MSDLKKLIEVLGLTASRVAGLPLAVRDVLTEANGILTQGESYEATRTLVSSAIRDKLAVPQDNWDFWLRDIYNGDQAIYEYDGKCYQVGFAVTTANGMTSVELDDAKKVQVAYLPIGEAKKISLRTDFVPLIESKAIADDGTTLIKLIAPVKGSSGQYTREVLERDGPTAFPGGMQMFLNHQTEAETADRPEGDLKDLAAVTTSPARYEEAGAAGPGLYADAKVFEPWRPFIEEVAPYTGVSIRASGLIDEAGMITEIAQGHSIDFVTKPGADGKVVQLFESARKRVHESRKPEEAEMDPKEIADLKEASTKQAAELAETKAELGRMKDAQTLSEARAIAATRLATTDLPDFVQERLVPQIAAKVVLKEGAIDTEAYEKVIDEAATKEAEYLSKLGGGTIRGMGVSAPTETDVTKLDESLAASFGKLGLSEAGVKVAVAGR